MVFGAAPFTTTSQHEKRQIGPLASSLKAGGLVGRAWGNRGDGCALLPRLPPPSPVPPPFPRASSSAPTAPRPLLLRRLPRRRPHKSGVGAVAGGRLGVATPLCFTGGTSDGEEGEGGAGASSSSCPLVVLPLTPASRDHAPFLLPLSRWSRGSDPHPRLGPVDGLASPPPPTSDPSLT